MPTSRNRKDQKKKSQARVKSRREELAGLKKAMAEFQKNVDALNLSGVTPQHMLTKTHSTSLTGVDPNEKIDYEKI
jgi:hypothetical protein